MSDKWIKKEILLNDNYQGYTIYDWLMIHIYRVYMPTNSYEIPYFNIQTFSAYWTINADKGQYYFIVPTPRVLKTSDGQKSDKLNVYILKETLDIEHFWYKSLSLLLHDSNVIVLSEQNDWLVYQYANAFINKNFDDVFYCDNGVYYIKSTVDVNRVIDNIYAVNAYRQLI